MGMTIHRLMTAIATEPVQLPRAEDDAAGNESQPEPAPAGFPDDRPNVAAE